MIIQGLSSRGRQVGVGASVLVGAQGKFAGPHQCSQLLEGALELEHVRPSEWRIPQCPALETAAFLFFFFFFVTEAWDHSIARDPVFTRRPHAVRTA